MNKETAEIGSGKRGPGRPKGSANKINRDVKEMVLAALHDAGGADYLRRQARDNPNAFLTLVGKLLPKQVTGKDGGPLIEPELRYSLSDAELMEIVCRGRPTRPNTPTARPR